MFSILIVVSHPSTQLAANLWHRLPPYKQTEEIFNLFENAAFLDPLKLFKNFDPEYDRDLLTGIDRWTYRFLRNFIYSEIRDREPLFGLSNLGVVSKSSQLCIRHALWSQTSAAQLKLDLLLTQVFKNYLKRSLVRTDRLQPSNWAEIYLEFQKLWRKSTPDVPVPLIEKIIDELNLVGKYVRQATNISIDSLDRSMVG